MNRINVLFLAVIGLVVALLLIQYLAKAREDSRSVLCQERLRKLGEATKEYQTNVGHLPPGTLGQSDGVAAEKWYQQNSPESWRRVPNTSAFGFVLPYFDGATNGLPAIALEFGAIELDWTSYSQSLVDGGAATKSEPQLLCPADVDVVRDPARQLVCATQPLTPPTTPTEQVANDDFGIQLWNGGKPIAASNFLANGGVTGGLCNVPDSKAAPLMGPMRSRSKTISTAIKDGESRTFLYGETIGRVFEGNRSQMVAWSLGGIGVIRGDFPAENVLVLEKFKTAIFLGSATNSSVRGFGSYHSNGVNFVMVGGEFGVQSRNIDPVVLFALSGISDGEVQPSAKE
jgi:Protein of unknown function (DUF1559)